LRGVLDAVSAYERGQWLLGPERFQKIVTELLRETPTSLIVQLIQDEWHWC
jgi:hypothetical protein